MTEAMLWYREKFWVHQKMCGSRKCPYSPNRRDGKFLGVEGGGGSQRSKLLGNVWSVHVIGISRGMERGSLRINPFHGNGMDNLWNYTIWYFGHYFHCRDNTCQSITTPNIWIFFQCKNRNRKVISTWAQHKTIAEMLLHIHFTPENFNILNTKFQLPILGRYYFLIKSHLGSYGRKVFF